MQADITLLAQKENIMDVDFANFDKHFSPKQLSDFVFKSQADLQLLESLISNKREFPGGGRNGILLYGPPGTGKTTLATLLPSLVEQTRQQRDASEDLYVHCFGDDKTEVEIVKLATRFINIGSDAYFYRTLDEVDSLTEGAMKALKSVMDTGNKNALYFFTTNNVKKISDAIRDRCHQINMVAPSQSWVGFVRRVLNAYSVKAYTDAEIISQILSCDGSARSIAEEARKLVQHYYNIWADLTPPVLP